MRSAPRPYRSLGRRKHAAWAFLLSLTLAPSCRVATTRAVVTDRPIAVEYEVRSVAGSDRSLGPRTATLPDEPTDGLREAEAQPMGALRAEPFGGPTSSRGVFVPDAAIDGREAARTTLAALLVGDGPLQLDAEKGPLDLGYLAQVDLGAGEAPYDDAVGPIHGVELRRGGFSDSVLQVSVRKSLVRGLRLHATGALAREQDLSFLEGLPDSRFSWMVVGCYLSW